MKLRGIARFWLSTVLLFQTILFAGSAEVMKQVMRSIRPIPFQMLLIKNGWAFGGAQIRYTSPDIDHLLGGLGNYKRDVDAVFLAMLQKKIGNTNFSDLSNQLQQIRPELIKELNK